MWRRVIAANGTHRLHVHEQFLHVLDTDTLGRTQMPGRVSLVGIPAIPPLYLGLFARLAECIDLHLFLLGNVSNVLFPDSSHKAEFIAIHE